jgi:chemotaxis protein methyltransferase CheR
MRLISMTQGSDEIATGGLDDEQKAAFIRLIVKQTGLELRERDREALDLKISSRMKALRLTSPHLYYQLLATPGSASDQEWSNLAILLTNTESYFFRDREQFSLLKHHIFPELIRRKRVNKTIRICSAGCSTGEEPYSIAILLHELIPDIERWNVLILGIDINRSALKKAEAGVYSAWSFRRVDAAIQREYFHPVNHQYHLKQVIKRMVRFQTVNLAKDFFPDYDSVLHDMDIILCRNVFIYFQESAIANVLLKFYHTLQPLGYLLTGHAELCYQDLSLFQTCAFDESFIYQRPSE